MDMLTLRKVLASDANNSVNLSADVLKARDLSPVKADVSQSAAIHMCESL